MQRRVRSVMSVDSEGIPPIDAHPMNEWHLHTFWGNLAL